MVVNSVVEGAKYSKTLYRELCANEDLIPLFSKDWWLDAVVGIDKWDVALVFKDGKIIASMPYIIKNRFGLKLCTLPDLTQYLGPWIKPSQAKYAKMLGQQKDIMTDLIEQLPRFDYFSQNWDYKQTNWLPFHWKGFQQTTNYTYVIADMLSLDEVWSNLQEKIRTDIRKATNRHNLIFLDNPSIEDFIELNTKVYERKNIKSPHSEQVLIHLDKVCAQRNARKIFIAADEDGRHHAGVYIVWDKNSAYYLLGGSDPELRNSGATSLCLWEAIKFASTVTKEFNFEGSMIEPVERFVRGFGGKQRLVFNISKAPSLLLRLRSSLLSLKGNARS
ncbi:GNAT family N-acetyltransferase [Amylibacter sp.]|nr:GNAT family N-acetyltransferase [Amylibacter sp.]